MSEEKFKASIVEVFPLRLAGEVLIDITLDVAGKGDYVWPVPDDVLEVETGDGPVKFPIWAAPRVSQPKGTRWVNVQIRREDVGERAPEEGMVATVKPFGG